ncbi:MAG: hypothetical protein R8G66_23225 [Cytophagales bacterium]|nr:hypothetical protein [Cytophagales bacterium]
MDPFEYVVVITSLITGLGIAQILNGIADVVSDIKNIRLSAPLSLLILSTFLNLIQEWFYNYQYATHVTSWTLLTVLGVLIYPILLFLLARMLFPTGLKSDVTDLDGYYFEQWKWFFWLSGSIILVSVFHDIFISGFTLQDQVLKLVLIAIHLYFLLFDVHNRKAHYVFQAMSVIGLIAFIVLTDNELDSYLP